MRILMRKIICRVEKKFSGERTRGSEIRKRREEK